MSSDGCESAACMVGALQARAAVLIRLQRVSEPREFARLMWLVEDLVYDDLLKGTGWGRRRGWFREQLEATNTLSQVWMPTRLHASLCLLGERIPACSHAIPMHAAGCCPLAVSWPFYSHPGEHHNALRSDAYPCAAQQHG